MFCSVGPQWYREGSGMSGITGMRAGVRSSPVSILSLCSLLALEQHSLKLRFGKQHRALTRNMVEVKGVAKFE